MRQLEVREDCVLRLNAAMPGKNAVNIAGAALRFTGTKTIEE